MSAVTHWTEMEWIITCPDCEEPWCTRHEMHYAECDCPGDTRVCDACGEWSDFEEPDQEVEESEE